MHLLIQNHQPAIANLCRRYRVQRLEVFGSASRGVDFIPGTIDADFLVEFSLSPDSPSLKVFSIFKAIRRKFWIAEGVSTKLR